MTRFRRPPVLVLVLALSFTGFPRHAVAAGEEVRLGHGGHLLSDVLFVNTGQTVAQSPESLEIGAKVGQMLVSDLVDLDNKQVAGVSHLPVVVDRLVDRNLLTLQGGQASANPQRNRDSLKNGILIGVAIGAAAGFLGSLAVYHCSGPCDADYYAGEWLAPVLLFTAVGAGVGAGVGAAIDAATVQAPNPEATRSRFTLSPLVQKGRQGMVASVGF